MIELRTTDEPADGPGPAEVVGVFRMSVEEALAMRGTGWEGDLTTLRASR